MVVEYEDLTVVFQSAHRINTPLQILTHTHTENLDVLASLVLPSEPPLHSSTHIHAQAQTAYVASLIPTASCCSVYTLMPNILFWEGIFANQRAWYLEQG